MSARDGVPAPAACMLGNGLLQCRNGAPRSAARYLPATVLRTLPVPRRPRNEDTSRAAVPCSVHPPALRSAGIPPNPTPRPPLSPTPPRPPVSHLPPPP